MTYARIASDPARWAKGITPGTLVIADEAHHLGEELAWGQAFAADVPGDQPLAAAVGDAVSLGCDADPGRRVRPQRLRGAGRLLRVPHAVGDGVCRPVGFITYDGTLSWRSGDDLIESSFEQVLSTREASRRYRTAIWTELPDGLSRILGEADQKLGELRAGEHGNAGGLVVAADGAHARRLAKLLRERTGQPPVVVLHSDTQAARKLAAFAGSTEPWIVAVNMVSEGVDIPRLRVGVYATAAKTPLIFRQIVGRFVRTSPGREPLAVVALPAGRSDSAPPRRGDRVGAAPGVARPRPAGASTRSGSRARERAERGPGVPAAERRHLAADDALRRAGAGAVGGRAAAPRAGRRRAAVGLRAAGGAARGAQPPRLRRPAAGGGTHQEINAWLNRALDLRSVEDATLDQLERSVELLVGRLTRRRPVRSGG